MAQASGWREDSDEVLDTVVVGSPEIGVEVAGHVDETVASIENPGARQLVSKPLSLRGAVGEMNRAVGGVMGGKHAARP